MRVAIGIDEPHLLAHWHTPSGFYPRFIFSVRMRRRKIITYMLISVELNTKEENVRGKVL